MAMALLAVILPATSLALPGARGDSEIKEKRDEPLATTFFFPKKIAITRDRLTWWDVYPYVGRRDNGEVYLRLRMDEATLGNSKSRGFSKVMFTVDGEQLQLWPGGAEDLADNTEYSTAAAQLDFSGGSTEQVARAVSAGHTVWLLCYWGDSSFRNNAKLNDKQLATFRLMVEKLDSLRKN